MLCQFGNNSAAFPSSSSSFEGQQSVKYLMLSVESQGGNESRAPVLLQHERLLLTFRWWYDRWWKKRKRRPFFRSLYLNIDLLSINTCHIRKTYCWQMMCSRKTLSFLHLFAVLSRHTWRHWNTDCNIWSKKKISPTFSPPLYENPTKSFPIPMCKSLTKLCSALGF